MSNLAVVESQDGWVGGELSAPSDRKRCLIANSPSEGCARAITTNSCPKICREVGRQKVLVRGGGCSYAQESSLFCESFLLVPWCQKANTQRVGFRENVSRVFLNVLVRETPHANPLASTFDISKAPSLFWICQGRPLKCKGRSLMWRTH